MKIFIIGGGTGGATAPAIAVGEAVAKIIKGAQIFFIGNKSTETKMLKDGHKDWRYLIIPAGKWRRYFSLLNFLDLFKIFFGFIKSFFLMRRYRPNIVFGAGSFVQVPMAFAAFLNKIPVVIHQPDLLPLLSTRLAMPFAKIVTVSFNTTEKELPEFSGLFKKMNQSKIRFTGNPVRKAILTGDRARAKKIFSLRDDYPVLLVIGGSQGSAKLNETINTARQELVKYVQIIHITGDNTESKNQFVHDNYHSYQFLGSDLADGYEIADLVLCRGGISTISELSALGKASIVVPLPNSPQEANARLLFYKKSAVVVFEEYFTADLLLTLVRRMLWHVKVTTAMKNNFKKILPASADMKIAKIIQEIYESQGR